MNKRLDALKIVEFKYRMNQVLIPFSSQDGFLCSP